MDRVLITGGTGFVGSHLVPFLQTGGAQIALLASTRGRHLSDVKYYEADIRDLARVHAAVHDFKPDGIYHLAAISSVPNSWNSPRLTYEVNVFGTLNVLESAASLPTPAKVLNVSTAQVYAPSSSVLDETSPLAPDNPYAASKAMAEFLSVQLRGSWAGGIITARSFNHAGPGQSPDFVLSSIAKQFAEIETGLREPKLMVGNLHVARDFTDVRDVIRAYALLLAKGRVNEIYNVCSGTAWSIKEIIELFQRISGLRVAIESDPGKQRAGENTSLRGCLAKIRAATGWEPEVPLKTTLQDLFEYWRGAVRNHQTSASEKGQPSLRSA